MSNLRSDSATAMASAANKQELAALPHVIIVPSPGLGHLIPLTEFSRRLVLRHNLFLTFLIPSDDKSTASSSSAQKSLLESLPAANIEFNYLPPVTLDDLPEWAQLESRMQLTVTRSLPALRDELLKSLSAAGGVSAVIVDIFSLPAIDLLKELGIPAYIFYTTTAFCLSLGLHMPELDKNYSGEFRDLPDPIKLPGCVPLLGKDLSASIQDRNSDSYKGLMEGCKKLQLAEGILINSFVDLEFGALNSFKGLLKSPVYPVGPLVRPVSFPANPDKNNDNYSSYCLKWLDEQPKGSVLYVSFGSGGTLSTLQLNELAHGLEMSGQKFLWVLKTPNEKAVNAEYFGIKTVENPTDFLPAGFLKRTAGKGIIAPSWAPQIEILSHGSTGGFVTHCGWNSILESIVHGVVMIAWPLYAEQKMNAVLLTEDLGIALRVKADESSGLVGREEIARLGKGIIEGEEKKKLGSKMHRLKEAASMALKDDVNGSSAMAISEFAQKFIN